MKKITRVTLCILGILLSTLCADAAEITIGTGTSNWTYPLSTGYHDARTQTIYLASEIGAAKTIDSLALYVSTKPGQTMNNFTIRLKHTDLSAYSSLAWESSGWTTVYQTNQTISATGWVTFPFTTEFAYNGTQNLMVDISFNNASYTSTGYCRYSVTNVSRSVTGRTNSGYGDPLTWSGSTPTPGGYSYFLNIKLGYGVKNVVFTPDGGTYNTEQNVVITCPTSGATIHYTTNGLDPTESDPVIASGSSLYVDHTLALKARAWKVGLDPSDVKSASYQIEAAIPTFSVADGTYNTEKNVVITCATSGAAIHYTTNGLDPTQSDPNIASGSSILVDHSMTLKAKAWKGNMTPSSVKSATYNLVVSTPAFSAAAGTYNTEMNVVITCATPGATIRYTIDGSDPNGGSVFDPNFPVIIDHSLTLKAKAWKGSLAYSSINSAAYNLVVSTPVFSVAAGTYNTDQNVTIFCITPDAVIHYTTSGIDPTQSDPIIASGSSILVDHSLTLKAKAWKANFAASIVKSAAYQLVVATPIFTPDGGAYDSDQTIVITCATPGVEIHYTYTHDLDHVQDPQLSDPVIENGGSVVVTANPPSCLKARAWKTGIDPSAIRTAIYQIKYSGGIGTPQNPFKISSKTDLLALSSDPDPNEYGHSFILTSDIDLGGQIFNTSIISADPNIAFDPNQTGTPFSGTFDGNGHKITNFSIQGQKYGYYGFFGRLNSTGVITNLGLENCTISGNYVSGALAGRSYGVISNCYSTGSVTGSASAGSLVGLLNSGLIVNCYSTGTVNSGDNLTGVNSYGTVSHCYSIEPSSSSGYIYSGSTRTSKTVSQMKDINAFLTAGWDFLSDTSNGTCNNWLMPAGGYPVLATFNGYTPPQLEGSGTREDPYIVADAIDLGTIWYRPWAHYALANDIDPDGIKWGIAVVPVFGGVFEGNDFSIRNLSINGKAFLGLFGMIRASGQVNNLMMENCSIIGGTDSSGYDIGGLAGRNYGTISQCSSTGTASGYFYVGGLVGTNYNTVNACYSGSTAVGYDRAGSLVGENFGSISDCHATGSVNCNLDAGGLTGRNNGSMNQCHWHGTLSNPSSYYNGGVAGLNSGSISQCFSSGAVLGNNYIGGLVGFNYYNGSISDSYSTCSVNGYQYIGGLAGRTVSGGIIIRSYSTGAVSGTNSVGGLVGAQSSSSITNSFWDTQTSGRTTSAGGTGKTTAQMKTLSTFTSAGWNFSSIWDICVGTNYPRLVWQIPDADWVCPDGVSTEDLDYFVTQWLENDCTSTNNYCGGVDMDTSGKVDLADFAVLADNWLQGYIPLPDPNSYMWVTGHSGNALSFNGVSSYVKPGYYGIGGTNARTVSLWMKTANTGIPQALVQWGSGAAGQLWYLRLEASGIVFMSAYSTGVMSSQAVNDNQWHLITAVLDEGQTDPTQIRLYIDGLSNAVPFNSGTINTTQTVSVHLGVWYRTPSGSLLDYFAGLMDDVRIYNRALSASEINPSALPETGLVTHWAMDETTGTVAHDSVSSYDGTLIGY